MVVVTGGSGRLGRSLLNVFPQANFPNSKLLNICDPASVTAYIERHPPSVFVHAAAMTDVRQAEVEHCRCWDTNVRGVERLVDAIAANAPDCYFVYISTACVFRGDRGDYAEDDVPNPKNFYGLSKLVGEYVARRMHACLIVRTNFVAFEPWPYPRAFTDRFGTYLFAADVAEAIRGLVEKRELGVVHVCGDKRMSMYDLAHILSPEVGSMTMADVILPLTRDMTLCSTRLAPIKIGSGLEG
jgi:dTDP-4-dehydrorhamnose reductase